MKYSLPSKQVKDTLVRKCLISIEGYLNKLANRNVCVAGNVSVNCVATSAVQVGITFPSGTFKAAPQVALTPCDTGDPASLNVSVLSRTATGCTIAVYSTLTINRGIGWIACGS